MSEGSSSFEQLLRCAVIAPLSAIRFLASFFDYFFVFQKKDKQWRINLSKEDGESDGGYDGERDDKNSWSIVPSGSHVLLAIPLSITKEYCIERKAVNG